MPNKYWEKAQDQAAYLDSIDLDNTNRVMVECAQGVIWALLAVAEAMPDA